MIEKIYLKIKYFIEEIHIRSIPHFRRFLRFLALPYCYFVLINWDVCTAPKIQVIKDLIYIFFKLKYFPDNYSLCRFWEKDRSEWHQYYGSIYDPYQRGKLRKEVQKPEYQILFEDKEVCYQLCKVAGLPLPRQYACVDPDEDYKSVIMSILNADSKKKVIIKPVRGKGGAGIFLACIKKDNIIIQENVKRFGQKDIPLDDFILLNRSVVQEFVDQHEKVKKISSSSVNTLRIATLLTKEKSVLIVGAIMRFGVNAFVDNTSSGGIGVGVDIERGALKERAHDLNSKTYLFHPTSGIIFSGYKIPYWDEVVSLAKKVQFNISYCKLLGIDIAITSEGPILIEINNDYDNVGLEQKYGPILADESVRKEFGRYNLFINKYQRNL